MSQSSQEFKPKKEVEIKFFRLSPPVLVTSPPLSGIYHNIDSIEDPENIIDNKFTNFEINTLSPYTNQSLFSLSPSFGRVFHKEILEGLLTFKNKSDHEITLKTLEGSILVDEKSETKTKNQKYILDIKLPKEGIILDKSEVYSMKFVCKLEFASKYTIYIELKVKSATYDYQYNEAKQKNLVKDEKDFIVDGESVIIPISKKLTFDVIYPIKVYEKFHNYQMNTCFIELQIINISIYPLTLTDLYLNPKSKPEEKLLLVDSLQELSKNQSQNLFSDLNFQSKSSDFIPSSKYLTLQPDEEMNVLFKITDSSLFLEEEKYILNIKWLNLFDVNEKDYIYEFSNTLNTYNNYYKITVLEKPEKNIIINENFKIILKLETKNINNNYIISLSQETLRDNDKSNDKEIEIIDITEKKIKLNKDIPQNNFVLICKSNVLGNVYLPRLKFLLYEDTNSNPTGNVFDALLTFNCIQKKENNKICQ
jgi:hypothetical protein